MVNSPPQLLETIEHPFHVAVTGNFQLLFLARIEVIFLVGAMDLRLEPILGFFWSEVQILTENPSLDLTSFIMKAQRPGVRVLFAARLRPGPEQGPLLTKRSMNVAREGEGSEVFATRCGTPRPNRATINGDRQGPGDFDKDETAVLPVDPDSFHPDARSGRRCFPLLAFRVIDLGGRMRIWTTDFDVSIRDQEGSTRTRIRNFC